MEFLDKLLKRSPDVKDEPIPDVVELEGGCVLNFPTDWNQERRRQHLKTINEAIAKTQKSLGLK